MTTPNEKLIEAIKSRGRKQTEFGHGILTADKYVRTLQECVGVDACYKYAAAKSTSFEDVLQKASNTLTYRNQDMTLDGDGVLWGSRGPTIKQISNGDETIELPKNTLMVFRHVLTTPRKDRDGDVLRTAGARVDDSMLLLWQHVHTLPIGKMLAVAEHNANKLTLISAIVDGLDLAQDAAVMIDNDMARFSHGFRALSFEELKEEEGEVTSPGGFDIKEFEIMEASVVSVPSNVDAETEEVLLSLVEGGKLTSGLMKAAGKTIREHRPVRSSVTYSETMGDYKREIAAPDVASFETVFEKTNGKSTTETACGCGKGQSTGASKETDDQATATKTTDAENAEVKSHRGPLSNSWEDIERKLRSKAKRYLIAMAISVAEDDWTWLAGTFADHAIVCVEKRESGVVDEFRYFRIEWEMRDNEPEFKGEPEQVEIVTTTEIVERSPATAIKSGETDTKAGRVLSRANLQKLEDVKADLEELASMDQMTRAGSAICERCITKLASVIGSAGSGDDETSTDAFDVKSAMTLILADGTPEEQKRMAKALHVLEAQRHAARKAKQYRTLVGVN